MTLPPPRFTVVTARESYATPSVDAAVDRIREALSALIPTMTADEVAGLRFSPVRLRHGYEMSGVDAWLDLAADELARRATLGPDDAAAAPLPPWRAADIQALPDEPDPRILDGRMTVIVLPVLALVVLLTWLLAR